MTLVSSKGWRSAWLSRMDLMQQSWPWTPSPAAGYFTFIAVIGHSPSSPPCWSCPRHSWGFLLWWALTHNGLLFLVTAFVCYTPHWLAYQHQLDVVPSFRSKPEHIWVFPRVYRACVVIWT
jgi:hypothetical protein